MINIESLIQRLKTRKYKNIFYIVVLAIVFIWIIYRFTMVYIENNLHVYNIARENLSKGVVIDTLVMHKQNGSLFFPINVKNNKIFVPGNQIKNFKVGQNLGNCKIVHISSDVDLDTGVYVIQTAGCIDGLQYVELKYDGYFVPVYAIKNNSVMIVQNGIAVKKNIVVKNIDLKNAVVESGIEDGDIVILTSIPEFKKVKILK